MPNARNLAMMESIKADLAEVSAMWIVDACGLTVKEVEALRRQIREKGATMKVYKNTVMRIALSELDMVSLDDILEGPSAFVMCTGDVAAAAKAVTEFAKTNDKLQVKGGLMDGKAVSAAEVAAIASLPSKEELIAKIAGAISGVARGLATSINGVPRNVAQVVKAVSDQKAA